MLNIYNSLNLNLSKKHKFSVFLSKSLNKKEKKFLKTIYLSNEILDKNNINITYKIEEILYILKYENSSQLEKFLNNIINKRVSYSVEEDGNMIQNGSFGIINSFSINNNRIYFSLSEELLLSFIENTLFSYLKIDKFIFMEESFSYNLYLYLIPLFLNQKEITINLNQLKQILNTKSNYTRFFDFEKYILKKSIDDIITFSKYNISYVKIKTGQNVNNKVTAIKFILNNEKFGNYFNSKKVANSLFNMIKDNIDNVHEIYELLLIYLSKRNYNYVLENINYTLKNASNDNFEKTLKKALLCDLRKNDIPKDKFNLYVDETKYFKTPFILQMNLWKHLKALSAQLPNFYDIDKLYYSDFFKKIINLKNKEIFEFSNNSIKIFIQFNEKEKSTIKISMFNSQ